MSKWHSFRMGMCVLKDIVDVKLSIDKKLYKFY